MSKQTVTLELDVPDGYEATGEFRVPNEDEQFLLPGHAEGTEPDAAAIIWTAGAGATVTGIILRKLPSPTVTVELPRETAEALILQSRMNPVITQGLADACRAALAEEQA